METKRQSQLEFGWQTGPTRAVARRTDPETSREAAKSVDVRRTQFQVLWLFGKLPKSGMPDAELLGVASFYNVQQSDSGLRSRRCELTRMGYLEPAGTRVEQSSGRRHTVHRITQKGLDRLQAGKP